MRNWIIGVLVAVVASALGVGAAYGTKTLLQTYAPAVRSAVQSYRGQQGQQPRNGLQNQPWSGQQNPSNRSRFAGQNAAPLTLDEAVQQAQALAGQSHSDWKAARVIEFQNAFDVIFVESGTGRGAAQILIGKQGRGIQPAAEMQWNLKYGSIMRGPMMGQPGAPAGAADNSVSLADARTAGQAYLTSAQPGATLNEGAYSFYGYYLFEYSLNGKTAGVVMVNGLTSQVAQLKALGAFLSEKEIS
jgi:hypothetical protein